MFKKLMPALLAIVLFFCLTNFIKPIPAYREFFEYSGIMDKLSALNTRITDNKAKNKSGVELEQHSATLHVRNTKPDTPLSKIIGDIGIDDYQKFNLYVDLESRTMYFRYGNTALKQYRISAGTKTDGGDKEKEGDFRTPRGEFYICTKVKYSPPKGYLGSRWMLLSYPTIEDAERGLKKGLITLEVYNDIKESVLKKEIPPQNTILGSAIGIHGGARPGLLKDWTAGCIGMYDQDVEEIFEYVNVGTRVVIE